MRQSGRPWRARASIATRWRASAGPARSNGERRVGVAGRVAFRRDERAGTGGDLRREGRELLLQHRDVAFRIAGAGGVHEVTEKAAPLDVLQEPDAEPRPLMRPLDQTGDIGDDE